MNEMTNYDRLVEALRDIACFDDTGANARLTATGSYGAFDEPSSVQIARQALAALDAQGEGDTVWIGRMGSAEEMLGRFCTIGKFDPADRPWAFHYHSSKDAAQTFAESMTEHGSPAIVIEVVEYYAPPTEPAKAGGEE